MKKFSKIIKKRFDNLNKFVSKNQPTIQISILFAGVLLSLYVIIQYINRNFKIFFDLLAVGVYFDSNIFFLLTILALFLIIIRYRWLKEYKENDFIKILKKSLNIYIILALYLSTLLIYHGYFFLTINFAKKLPFDNNLIQWSNAFDIVDSSLKNTPSISCYSLTAKNDFVFNDKINCYVNITHKNDSLYPFTVMFAKIDLLNGSSITIKNPDDETYTFKKGIIPFELQLNDYGYYRFHVAIGLKNNTEKPDTGVYSIDTPLEIISREEYSTKNIQKFSLIVTLLVIVGFATFGLVKNIKELID